MREKRLFVFWLMLMSLVLMVVIIVNIVATASQAKTIKHSTAMVKQTLACPPTDAAGNPINCQGYVTNGQPQDDDAHCLEPGQTTLQEVACLSARRIGCPGQVVALTRVEAMQCWAPEINVYPWNHLGMFDALYCESKGDTTARNGRYGNLFQDDGVAPGSTQESVIQAFEHAYWQKWVPAGGPSPWRETYYHMC